MCPCSLGLVGLSLSYALSLTGLLSGLVSSFTQTEAMLVSVERLEEYCCDLPQEPQEPPGWPQEVRSAAPGPLPTVFSSSSHLPACMMATIPLPCLCLSFPTSPAPLTPSPTSYHSHSHLFTHSPTSRASAG